MKREVRFGDVLKTDQNANVVMAIAFDHMSDTDRAYTYFRLDAPAGFRIDTRYTPDGGGNFLERPHWKVVAADRSARR